MSARKKRIVIIASILVIASSITLACFIFYQKINQTNPSSGSATVTESTINYDKPNSDQLSAQALEKEAAIDNSSSSIAKSALITITGIDQSTNSLEVGSIVNGYSEGTCQYVLSKYGHGDISQTSPLLVSPTSTGTAYCNTSLPIGNIGDGGEWQLQISLHIGSLEKARVDQKVIINK